MLSFPCTPLQLISSDSSDGVRQSLTGLDDVPYTTLAECAQKLCCICAWSIVQSSSGDHIDSADTLQEQTAFGTGP